MNQPHELLDQPLRMLSAMLRTNDINPVDLANATLERLSVWEPHLNAFALVNEEAFMAEAKEAQQALMAGQRIGPLHGIPIGIKDIFDTRGVRTASGSAVRSNYVPKEDAAAVSKVRAAGMLIVGKTTTHEFAHGGTTPGTANPWDSTRIPGGSSGGSGAAVGAGIVHVALGTDTAGSIRIPAAVCGAVGLKPTFGRVSRFGVTPLSWSLDHVGPITRNVEDAALMLEVLAGSDPRDPATGGQRATSFSADLTGGVKGLRVGIPENYFTDKCDPEAAAAAANAATWLEAEGANLVPVTLAEPELSGIVEWTLLTAEASAYQSHTMRSSPELFGNDVRMLNEVGETILATDYINALRLRTVVRGHFKELFKKIDILLAPTVSSAAALRSDPVVRWPDGTLEGASAAYTRFCLPANVSGLPALQVPAGFTKQEGLPLGVQLMGRPYEENTILRAGLAIERFSPVRGRRPRHSI